MPQPTLKELLSLAAEAAYLAGRRTLAHFNTGVLVEDKADATPVTIADREAEQIIRQLVARHYPTHAILGEEQGESAGDPRYKWIIDPIDGTKSFIHGVPIYGTMIAVEIDDRPRIGVVYLPALDEMVMAAEGLGCTWNGRPARVSSTATLAQATLLTSSFTTAMARSDAFETLAAQVKLTRGWGDCYGHLLVATGRADIMLDPKMNPWDCAPLLPIVTEAGGRFTDWQGQATIYGEDAVSTNAALHQTVIEVLRNEKHRAH
jgi:histidinol phosphatase-like enzyme (inositol monophosphatase family)